jgi:hypothetical protein
MRMRLQQETACTGLRVQGLMPFAGFDVVFAGLPPYGSVDRANELTQKEIVNVDTTHRENRQRIRL